MIKGIGIDICDVKKLKNAVNSRKSFMARVFSGNEIKYCCGKKNRFLHLAGRFAAKEAFIKAVSVDKTINLSEIETVNDRNGRPDIKMSVKIRSLLRMKGAKNVMVSITHTGAAAAAVCILE